MSDQIDITGADNTIEITTIKRKLQLAMLFSRTVQ